MRKFQWSLGVGTEKQANAVRSDSRLMTNRRSTHLTFHLHLVKPKSWITGKPHLTACCSDRSHHAASDSCTAERRGPEGRASLSSKLWFLKGLSGFPDDFPGLFVVSKRNELRVTKMV